MKFPFFLFLLIPLQGSTQEFLWAKFVSERGRCSLNQNYLKINNDPILRVQMFIEIERCGSITDYFWLRQRYKYQFEYQGLDLYLVKRDVETDEIIWNIHIDSLKYAIIR